MKITKMFCLINRSNMRHQMCKFKGLIITCDSIDLIKFLGLLRMVLNFYLKTDVAGYHTFTNLLVNHIEYNFVEY